MQLLKKSQVLKSIFAMSVRKNQFKFQIAAFFLVAILIWIDFYAITRQKDYF